MTVLRATRAPVALGTGKPVSTRTSGQWVRPSDWLTLTPPAANEQKFVGLIAVFDQGSNYVALRATVSSGTYTVDWGDGSSPVTVTSNTNAEKNYSYSSLSSSTESSRGYRQAIVTVTPTTVGATFSLFGLNYRHSARSSTSTVPGWLDVAVSAPNATEVRLGGRNSSGTQTVLLNFLEQATVVSHNTTTMAHMFRDCRELQSVPLFNTAAVTTMESMFQICSSLQSVPLFNTAAVTDMSVMFNGCSSLQSVPLFNTAAVTNMASMFNSCRSLQSVPLFNTAAVTDMSVMFNGCSSLQSVPLFNTAAVTNMVNMFATCSSLQSVPLFNTAAVTDMSGMFQSCTSLQTVPLFNTAAVTNMASMFNSCPSLQTVPLFNTASVTNMSSMFSGCTSLQTVPLFNTASATNMNSMFATCTSLREIPELTMSAISSATNNNNMALTGSLTLGKAKLTGMRWTQSFSGCNMAAAQLDEMYTALDKLNPNVTNVTATGTVVTYTVDDITAFVAGRTVTITGVDPIAYNLTNVTIATVDVANSRFTVVNAATGTYVSGGVAAIQDNRTITVTGNPGTTGDDPTIAENKGWTVTG
jgi:surface protein